MSRIATDWGRASATIGWTVVLATCLGFADRALLPEHPAEAWHTATRIQQVPPSAGHVLAPDPIPPHIGHLPVSVLYRSGADPGWWIGYARPTERVPVLWIGSGARPDDLNSLVECLDSGRCPEPWTVTHAESGERTVSILSGLPGHPAQTIGVSPR